MNVTTVKSESGPVTSVNERLRRIERLQPVFIVGTPKSGTTFLLSLFDSHPSVITLLESAVYHVPSGRPASLSRLMAKLREFYAALEHNIHPAVSREAFFEMAQAALAESPGSLPKRLLQALLAVALEKSEDAQGRVTHFIEKTPRQYDAVDRMFEDFPNAKVIHVLRDPRDNYLALRRMMLDPEYQGINYQPTNFIRDRLLASLDAAYRNVDRHGDRYRILFYEDLILGGEGVVREVASWLGIPWHEVLLVPSENGELWRGNSLAPDLRDQLKPFDRRPIGRWKTALSEREVLLVEYVIKAYKLEGKYALTCDPSRWDLIGSLAPPFPGELRWNSLRSGKELARQAVNFVRWNYGARRWWIYRHLQHCLLSADTRLTGKYQSVPLTI